MAVQFCKGMYVRRPSQNAPEFVIANLTLDRAELIAWLNEQPTDKVRVDVLASRTKDSWFVAVNNWKPGGNTSKPVGRQPPARAPEPTTGSEFDFDDAPPF